MKKPNWLIATALIVAMSCTACSTSPGSTDKSVKHTDSAVTSEDTHNHTHKSSDETKKSDTKDAASEKTKEFYRRG